MAIDKDADREERLSAKIRNIVAHATGGSVLNGDKLDLNEICVRITKMRNAIYEAGKEAGRAEK